MEGHRTPFGKGAARLLGLRSLSLFILLMGGLAFAEAQPPRPSLFDVAESRDWLALGHWRKDWRQGWRGWRSEVTGPSFFLADNGRTDPYAELRATLKAFAAPIEGIAEKDHAQCRFLARREFLFAKLAIGEEEIPRHPCREYSAWKAKLDPEGVSIVFASAYMGNAASLFGHTFLKFHGRENGDDKDLLNYGVSYFAYTGSDGGIPFALFGLTGGYHGYFSMKPYHETLREYANLEGRDVWEYRLSLTTPEVERLLNHLLELQQTHFDYYFLDRNCSYQLLAALDAAKPELGLSDAFLYHVIPADSVRVLAAKQGLVQSVRYRPSLLTTFLEAREPLGSNELSLSRRLVAAKSSAEAANARLELEALDKDRRLLVLDSSLAYVDWLGAKQPTAYLDRAHGLKTQRASLGLQREPASASLHATARARPETGHDSARVGPTFGTRGERFFSGLQFRFAYHDLLSDDAGHRPDAHLEVLRAEVRGWAGPGDLRELRLHELTALEIVSLPSVDEFMQPLAWRAKAGATNLEDIRNALVLAPSLSGGVGAAASPLPRPYRRHLTLFTFAQGHAEQSDELRFGYRAGLSWQAQALARVWNGRARMNLGYETKRYFLGDEKLVPTFWARAGVSLSRNWEIRLSASEASSVAEKSAMLLAHFML